METKIAEPFFIAPKRTTPRWEQTTTVPLTTRELFIKVATGHLPIGLLPFEIITESERKKIVAELKQLQSEAYENTKATEAVYTKGGLPFVNYKTLTEYLDAKPDPNFERLTQPLLDRYIQWFESLGFIVEPLIDPVTMLPYHSKVCRHIAVSENCFKEDGNQCTVAHMDFILRDGGMKPDFRIPLGLRDEELHQISLCTLLENGGFRPDDLFIYEVQYSPELESLFDDWRPDPGIYKSHRLHRYTPVLRETYMFSTLNIHDVRGGQQNAERLNFSVFFVYAPARNTLYYYN